MPFSGFKRLWIGMKPLVTLRTINVSYSKNLQVTPDFYNSKLVEKLLLCGCKSLIEVHPSIGQLTNLGHLDFGKCNQLKELPQTIGQLAKLEHFDLSDCLRLKRLPAPFINLANMFSLIMHNCPNLKQLPEDMGDMQALKRLDVSGTAIENLPDSCERLIRLVELDLSWCRNLASLPNGIWKLMLLRVLNLHYCLKLERLPKQLGKMQCLEELDASCTSIEELPASVGLLSRLKELDLSLCNNLKYLPDSIGHLTSVTKLYTAQGDKVILNLPDTVKNLNLETLSVSCDMRLCLPMILSFSCLKTLTVCDEAQNFSSTEPLSFSTIFGLEDLTLYSCTSMGSSFPELPLNLKQLNVHYNLSLKQLPDLSSLKQLQKLSIFRCNSLQSLSLLPPHLKCLKAQECTSLRDLPDLSMLNNLETLSFINCSSLKFSLKQSFLQVGIDEYSSFSADLPNREIPEWLSYKCSGCTASLDIPPPSLKNNFSGVALWVLYTCKKTSLVSHIGAIIYNKTEGIKEDYDIFVPSSCEGEVHSRVECISGDRISVKSGDRIEVSFVGEAKVKMCGVHLINKKLCSP